MADGNQASAGNGDPNSPIVSSDAGNGDTGNVDPNSFNVSGGGGGGDGSTNRRNLRHPDQYESMCNGGRRNPPNAYKSGTRGSGDLHDNGYTNFNLEIPFNLHGGGGSSSNGSGYPRGNVYLDWHGLGGGGGNRTGYMSIGSSSSSSWEGGDLHALANGYANLHGSDGGGSSGSHLHYGYLSLYGNGSGSGNSSRAIDQCISGYVSYGSYNNGYGRATGSWPNFNGTYAPQQAPTNNLYAGDDVPPFVPEPHSDLSRPPRQPGMQEFDVDFLIGNQLRSLTIGNSYVDRRNTMAGSGKGRQQDRHVAGEQGDTALANACRVRAVDPYRFTTLEDVRGEVARVARDLHGCRFLRRMVDEREADAVSFVLDEVGADVVGLLGNRVSATLVDDLASMWTDEQVACVLRTLAASSPWDVMTTALTYSGSNVLQKLISRIEARRDQIESFMRCLACVGESNVLTLIKDHAGGRVIQKCLETFSPEHNLFIVRVVMRHPYGLARDQHGCHTMKCCIDNSVDVETRDFLVRAVCDHGLTLAQDQFGNYVVQHVITAVRGAPWAMERLHADFRGRYVSLSRHKAGSNVVQQCVEFFPLVYSEQIVRELLLDPVFHDLIDDPYANYVLQSAIRRTEGLLLRQLAEAVRPYRNILRDNIHSRRVFQMLFPSRR